MSERLSRRVFVTTAAGVAAAAGIEALAAGPNRQTASAAVTTLTRVDSVPTTGTRTWLAPAYWANRLADWRLNDGRIESMTAGPAGRTVAVLTRELVAGSTEGAVSVRTGTLATGTGFSGFLVGAGGGLLDWRAAALVMGASGQGGGLLATYDSDGHVRFREHTDENNPFTYAELPAVGRSGPAPARGPAEDVELRLDLVPTATGTFDLALTARRFADRALLSQATLAGVAASAVVGGLSLISTPRTGGTTARHWFRELRTGGPKIAVRPRATGPVLAILYSLNGSVLKLTAQFMPIGTTDPQTATLQRRVPGTTAWTPAQTTSIGAGFVALFRVPNWDGSREWEYRVLWGASTTGYSGIVRRNPTDKPTVSVAMVNCTIHTYRPLDRKTNGRPRLPGEVFRGLYTTENLYFPYAELVANLKKQGADLLVAFGDQYYETLPTRRDPDAGPLDVLSRYYLWLWSFAELTRNTPTICLVDDHDLYHPNIWGWSGQSATASTFTSGGYLMPASWVNTVQSVQCGHNPDAYDPRPVLHGIGVYYAAFTYGGVSFAILEDRKFKNTNRDGVDLAGNPLPPPRDLLGARQETFLQAWASMHPGQPKVCLTQTLFASLQTDENGGPVADLDSNGTPVAARNTALRLLKQARAVVLSGDQHLGSLVRHGITTSTDGPLQFTAPAAGTAWQRWFQPPAPLPNSSGPNTGDFTDGFGNRFRVLAVANPKVTLAQVRAVKASSNTVGDRNLKREGYGVARIEKGSGRHVLECWPWQTDPSAAAAAQFPGWPYTLPFAQV